MQLFASIAEVEIQPPIRTKMHRVNSMVMLFAPGLGEHQFLATLIRFSVSIAIIKAEYVVTC